MWLSNWVSLCFEFYHMLLRMKQKTFHSQVSVIENVVPVLLELHQLRVLDISDEKDAHPFEMLHPSRKHISEFLTLEDSMMHLSILDISGESEGAVITKLHMGIESYKSFWKFLPACITLGNVHTCQSSLFLFLVHRTPTNVGNNFNS